MLQERNENVNTVTLIIFSSQYITPDQHSVLGQAELVVIDEAAAIPLPLVRKLMGPYLVFLSSTISGYEGTGRSLALKLIAELREESKDGEESNRKLLEVSVSYGCTHVIHTQHDNV